MKKISLLLILLIQASFAMADDKIPDVLKPWIPWVMDGHQEKRCPVMMNADQTRQCVWFGVLDLSVTDDGASFSQDIQVYAKGWVAIPGNTDFWPQDVGDEQQKRPVVKREGNPFLLLEPGEYRVSGRFEWKKVPEFLPLPKSTGLTKVTLRGSPLQITDRDEQGRLWLERSQNVEKLKDDSQNINVYRYLTDSVPAKLQTIIDISIYGSNRELKLGPVMPDGFQAVAMTSSLPIKLDKDGFLLVQGRSGQWQIEIESVSTMPLSKVVAPQSKHLWGEEIWVFESVPTLRLVEVVGKSSIDPNQTTLPQHWRSWPTYALSAGEMLEFQEQGRGRSGQEGDRLTLNRTYWLDFDGKGATIRDQIQGELKKNRRMEMALPYELGRYAIEGQEELITLIEGRTERGVEIRKEALQVQADSRQPHFRVPQKVLGWQHDFEKVTAVLNLPPGWSLFWAKGVDQATHEWVSSWKLFDFFLVLVIVVATMKLWGIGWGLLCLLMMVLVFQQSFSPKWIWLAVLLGEALYRNLPDGRIRKISGWYRKASLVMLVIFVVPFIYQEIRKAVYPILYTTADYYAGSRFQAQAEYEFPNEVQKIESMPLQSRQMTKQALGSYKNNKWGSNTDAVFQRDPTANIQTGPGINSWQALGINLVWQGPVKKEQTMQLILFSPFHNRVLAFLRVALLLMLSAFFIKRMAFSNSATPTSSPTNSQPPIKVALMAGMFLMLSSQVIAQEIPSPALLEDLRGRLLKSDCTEGCLHLPRMSVEIDQGQLNLTLVVNALEQMAFALPGHEKNWQPTDIELDGEKTAVVYRDENGTAFLLIDKGVHQVVLKGKVPSNNFSLPLPQKPESVRVGHLEDWVLSGIDDQGKPAANLNFTREQPVVNTENTAHSEFMHMNLKPLLVVERHFLLGLEWNVETKINRQSPLGTPLKLEIPLLPGESVVGGHTVTEDRKLVINLGPQEASVLVESRLPFSEKINLVSGDGKDFFEVWHLHAGSTWHVRPQGFPSMAPDETGVLSWYPWPGEKLSWDISQPKEAPGQLVTIDHAEIKVVPGKKETTVELQANLRASLGGKHTIKLSPDSVIKSLKVAGVAQPVRFEKGQLTFSIKPGSQKINVAFSNTDHWKWHYQTPQIDLGAEGANLHIKAELGRHRWVLFLKGLPMGPVIVFWAYFVTSLAFALMLSRVRELPLGTFSWIYLSMGLTQLPFGMALIIVGWFFILRWRDKSPLSHRRHFFNFRQLLIAGWTLVAMMILLLGIWLSLGYPNMMITGNGSSASQLVWYGDRILKGALPQVSIYSLPLYVYHIFTLSWSLWVALVVIKWMGWAWKIFQKDGAWKSKQQA